MKNFVQKRTRYLRQPDHYCCSAIALLNLDKWRGIKVTKKNLPQYKRLCKTDPITGTQRKQFNLVAGKRGRKLSYGDLKKHNGAIILESWWPDGWTHCYLILGWATDGKHFGWLAVNYIEGTTYSLISPAKMKWHLKYSVGWRFSK